MSTPLVGHLDPEFLQIMNETQEMMRQAFRTRNPLTFPVSGTGSAGMETCVVNLIEPGDRMVVCVNGVFGQRMADVAERAGAAVTRMERPWGEVFDPGQIRDVLRKVRPKVLGVVHAETSTGAGQPMGDELFRLLVQFADRPGPDAAEGAVHLLGELVAAPRLDRQQPEHGIGGAGQRAS